MVSVFMNSSTGVTKRLVSLPVGQQRIAVFPSVSVTTERKDQSTQDWSDTVIWDPDSGQPRGFRHHGRTAVAR